MKKTFLLTTLSILFVFTFSFAQDDDDLLSLIEEEPTIDYATATFKANRVINTHSVENTSKGVLDFKINHRFSPLNQGLYDIFGLDGATVRFGATYGISNRFQIGLGRSTYEKTYDGHFKYKLFRQSSGAKYFPVTVSLVTAASINTLRNDSPDRKVPFWDRFTYVSQIIIGRKFNSSFSMQLAPTLVHKNLVPTPEDNNDTFALALGTRQKLTKRTSLNLEYIFVAPGQLGEGFTNSFSIGFDIETGGHVFQLHFTNSRNMVEKAFITETTRDLWDPAGIHFGFNISRVFTIRER